MTGGGPEPESTYIGGEPIERARVRPRLLPLGQMFEQGTIGDYVIANDYFSDGDPDLQLPERHRPDGIFLVPVFPNVPEQQEHFEQNGVGTIQALLDRPEDQFLLMRYSPQEARVARFIERLKILPHAGWLEDIFLAGGHSGNLDPQSELELIDVFEGILAPIRGSVMHDIIVQRKGLDTFSALSRKDFRKEHEYLKSDAQIKALEDAFIDAVWASREYDELRRYVRFRNDSVATQIVGISSLVGLPNGLGSIGDLKLPHLSHPFYPAHPLEYLLAAPTSKIDKRHIELLQAHLKKYVADIASRPPVQTFEEKPSISELLASHRRTEMTEEVAGPSEKAVHSLFTLLYAEGHDTPDKILAELQRRGIAIAGLRPDNWVVGVMVQNYFKSN